MPSDGKILGPVELVVLIVALLLIAYILLKNQGGSVYEKSETIQIIDNPQMEGGERQVRNYEMREEERVEVILQQLSEDFTEENNSSVKERINIDNAISDDELNYLEEVKQKHKEEEAFISPSDWLSILQASHKTYSKLKSVFEEADSANKKVKEDNVSNLLENAIVAKNIYSKIEELFNIPEEDARAFAKQGKKAISDWAEFVEQNQTGEGQ